MQGRWTIFVDADGEMAMREEDDGSGHPSIPVVPCDDAAIERGTQAVAHALYEHGPFGAEREIAEAVLRAAGETP